MGNQIVIPTIDGPLGAWCPLCRNRNLPPEVAYCTECRSVWSEHLERLDRGLVRRLLRRFHLLSIDPPAPAPERAPVTVVRRDP